MMKKKLVFYAVLSHFCTQTSLRYQTKTEPIPTMVKHDANQGWDEFPCSAASSYKRPASRKSLFCRRV